MFVYWDLVSWRQTYGGWGRYLIISKGKYRIETFNKELQLIPYQLWHQGNAIKQVTMKKTINNEWWKKYRVLKNPPLLYVSTSKSASVHPEGGGQPIKEMVRRIHVIWVHVTFRHQQELTHNLT